MRIAYANAFYHRNASTGGNAHVGQFAHNAVGLGHEVWTWPGDEHPETKKLPGNPVSRFLKLREVDAIYIRVEWQPPGPIRWSTGMRRRLLGLRAMVWEFNSLPEYGLLRGASEKDIELAIAEFIQFGDGCAAAICVSRTLADYVGKTLGIDRTFVIPNGSDPDVFRPDVRKVERISRGFKKLKVAWIGSAYLPWHNFKLLRDSAWLLYEDSHTSNVEIHLIGQGFPGLMRQMPPNVHFHGPETYEYIPAWLAAMDVGLCLYRPGPADFGSPVKLFDYMASGLLVVGTYHPQLSEIFKELGQTDLLVPPDDPRTLANLLTDLAQDHQRVTTQGRAGRRLVVDYYNWRRATTEALAVIDDCLSPSKFGPSAIYTREGGAVTQ